MLAQIYSLSQYKWYWTQAEHKLRELAMSQVAVRTTINAGRLLFERAIN